MSTVLWIIQGLLAFAFVAAGFIKLSKTKEELAPKIAWVEDFAPNSVRLIGAAEVVGGIGLIVPNATGILPLLTPLAAACLVVIMLGAAVTHIRRKELPMMVPALVLGGLSAFVAYGRFAIVR